MARFLAGKLLEVFLVALAVTILTFGLIAWTGDLAISIGGMDASAQDIERLRNLYGLNRPLTTQYLDWLGAVLHGDFGTSFFSKEDVLTLILSRLPVTFSLAVLALLTGLAVALPLGVYAATRPGAWVDRAAMAASVLGQSMPPYWTSLLLMLLFGVNLQWLPISGSDSWQSFVLPTLSLAWFTLPVQLRLARAGMIEVLRADYVRTARAKGLPSRRVLFKHALRNAILPVVSIAAVQLGFLLGGSIVVESVFALNGIGLLAWNAILRSDFPVVQAIVLIVALIFVALNFLADILNAYLDPRVRVG